ncbi:MAG: hypothetical protein RBU30_14365 [Polyangia bacterium]|jgi:hypothetical protein|nr:hypothetical protein [Polyangia bacterium]
MNRVFLIIGTLLVVGWIAFRLGWFVTRRLGRRGRSRGTLVTNCPKCGSGRLDELSDRESGYCLSCGHVWGADKP